jgi:D-lactate dehydrogenase
MNIAFFSSKKYDRVTFNEQIQDTSHAITYFEDILSPETVALARGFQAVCVFVNNPVDRNLMKMLSDIDVEVIALRSAGFNHIDLEAAKDFGIHVYRVPAYSPEAVAEHTTALILTLNRKTHKAYNRVRENNFSLEGLAGFNLYQKTVGVIGTGTIGAAFCRIMQGFGCNVIAFDPYPNETVKEMGVDYVEKEDLFRRSDIISLHCPLMPQTKYTINHEAIAMMKNGVMIINTSRGALVETSAAIKGLKNGKIGYMGIDVYEQEENLFFKDLSEIVIQDDEIARLMSFPNVLITGHQAFLTGEALHKITETTLQNLTLHENGEEVPNQVSV